MGSDIRASNNQAPQLVGHNVVTSDHALTDAITSHAGADVVGDLIDVGAEASTGVAREPGMLANKFHPELINYDRSGHRAAQVAFHPSCPWQMERARPSEHHEGKGWSHNRRAP